MDKYSSLPDIEEASCAYFPASSKTIHDNPKQNIFLPEKMSTLEKNKIVEMEEEPFGLGCALELFLEASEVSKMIDTLKTTYSDKSLNEKAYERFSFIIGQYKEQPHLLDPHIDQLLEKCINIVRDGGTSMGLKHEVFKYMFVFVNVRGYKVIVRHLPHEVADFEAILRLLEAQDLNDSATWTTRYVLLLWLSIIVMIPFHLSRFDASDETDKNRKTVMCRVLDIIKKYIVVPDKCRDAAAYLSSRFITRNDVKQEHLFSYIEWSITESTSSESNVFTKQGTLASIAMILKTGKRDDLLPHARLLLQWIIRDEIKQGSGTSVQKLVYKIVQRIGLTFLPPKVAAWRYKRGNRSLAANLSGGDGTTSSQLDPEENLPEDNIEVPDEVEEVIDQLINGLRSADGIVRWSAAKGVGRVTGRLPQELADEVVGSVLELFNPREGDGAWHGGCLALAELGRRGLLLPKRLPEVVPVVMKALVYDEPRGYSSVGSHIRDAACYVCWSFARAYDKDILKPFVNQIAANLLIVACFDREINCRRAASAAFQENVGRQGTFPYGIDILTVADFFTVTVRNNAYLTISPYIAQFEEYTIPMIDHLIGRKVDHWDCVIRELTAKALHNLTPKAPEYMVEKVLPTLFEKSSSIDLNARHGSVLAIGEIIYALSQNMDKIEVVLGDHLEKIANLVPEFRQKFYFRGLGGELMRTACCDFIEKCAMASLEFTNGSTTDDWLNLINECIAYNVTNIQTNAIKALPTVLTRYYSNKNLEGLVNGYIEELQKTSQQEVRMGHALALGALPKFVLGANLGIIIDALIGTSQVNHLTAKWAESRRDSIKALTLLIETMSDDLGTVLSKCDVLRIFDVFLSGLKDYTQDKRGDVGAWVREAAMLGLQTLTFKVIVKQVSIDVALTTQIVAGVAQQAVERIDRTRALAGRIFYSFLYSDPTIPNIPYHTELLQIFDKEDCETLNWNSASDTFPKFVELLQFPEFTYNVMLGLICSVGGLTETLVKNSSSSLFTYISREKKCKGVGEIDRLAEVVYSIFQDNRKNDRIVVPMFRFLDKLFSSGCVQHLTDDPTSDFCKKILKLAMAELVGCKDAYKIIDGINLLAQFVQVKSEACQSALVQLSIFLCHRQTYVRKSTASILYESLLLYGDSAVFNTENLDEAMQILSNTNWDDPVDVIKPMRNEICKLMGIRVPVTKTSTN
ncbi:tubulin-specific chaperone D [Tribolium madens]|uniref:tubulin-specific chaperone D n=1 Tax=Tribolium madens TaxID=41895 RepID=UPI001CF72833|nr:tubulin-specific chaperone D [Tribolium madens]